MSIETIPESEEENLRRSRYAGSLSDRLVLAIHNHTYVRHADGARFYRHIAGPWIPLRTDEDFTTLNRIVDCYR